MTFRAILLGLLVGVGIVTFGWVNDRILNLMPVAQGMVPMSVFGLLVFGLVAVQPLLRLLRRAQFRGREWAVMVALAMVAVVLPGPGLLWHFSQALVLPHHWQAVYPGWRRQDLLSYAPANLLADAGEPGTQQYEQVVGAYRTGIGAGGGEAGFFDVPWGAWSEPLTFWLTLVALFHVACICVVIIIHRQWAHRERVRYPVALFAEEILAEADRRPWPRIFYNRRFWMGFIPVFVIFLLQGLSLYEPSVITVPMQFDFSAVLQKWPGLTPVPDMGPWILRPRIVFVVIGFAYFISSEASFSLGISPIVFSAVWLAFYEMGVNPRGSASEISLESHQRFGSYLGIALMILYTGRRYYLSVAGRALGLAAGDDVSGHVRWAARAAVGAAAGMVLLLHFTAGLTWMLSILFTFLLLMMFLVLARINVETGLTSIHVWWHPINAALGLFGFAALGPNMFTTLAILSLVFTIEPRISMIAMGANALRITDFAGVATRRIAPWLVVVVIVALVAGVFCTIYVQYSHGVPTPGWSGGQVSQRPYQMLSRQLSGYFDSRDGWESFRWSKISPDPSWLWAAGIGLALVLIVSALRLRLPWWPLHPILFLVWGTWPLAVLGASFFLGWMLKTLITRFGGGSAYERNKPLFVGLVAGEFAFNIVFAAWGLIYYMVRGTPGPNVWLHP